MGRVSENENVSSVSEYVLRKKEREKEKKNQIVLMRSSLEGDRGKYGIDRLTWDSAVRHEIRMRNDRRRFRMSNGNGVYS